MGLMRRARSRKRAGGNREIGAALVEAALILPILLLMTFGIWATARAWNVNNTIDHATREAARFGATEVPWVPGTSDVAVRAVADVVLSASAIAPSDITNCIELILDTQSGTCDTSYTNSTGTDQVHVTLGFPNYPIDFLFFSVSVDLESTAVARFES